jgi:hypothetical protein
LSKALEKVIAITQPTVRLARNQIGAKQATYEFCGYSLIRAAFPHSSDGFIITHDDGQAPRMKALRFQWKVSEVRFASLKAAARYL